MERHRKGDVTEATVVAELRKRDISVSVPFGDNERYDLVAETFSGELLRLQVKTGRLVDGTVRFSCASQHTNTDGNSYRSYGDDIDHFVVYYHSLDALFLVSAGLVTKRMRLRVDSPDVHHPTINWVEDFEFDRQWSQIDTGYDPSDERLDPHRRGDATEATVIADLLERGITISIPPTDNERYDLIATAPSGVFHRIQIKTGWLEDGCVKFKTKTSHVNASGIVDKPYDGDVDLFIVYVPPLDETYLVANDEFESTISLSVDETKQVHRNTKRAEDYEFDKRWPPQGESDLITSSHRGQARTSVIEDFHELGVPVMAPTDDEQPYDFLAETPNGFTRLKLRIAQEKDGRVYVPPLEDPTDIDYQVLHC